VVYALALDVFLTWKQHSTDFLHTLVESPVISVQLHFCYVSTERGACLCMSEPQCGIVSRSCRCSGTACCQCQCISSSLMRWYLTRKLTRLIGGSALLRLRVSRAGHHSHSPASVYCCRDLRFTLLPQTLVCGQHHRQLAVRRHM
jgi:hypothetical protein